jgi:hypothetical protein
LPSPSTFPPCFSTFLKPLVSETFMLLTDALPKSLAALSQSIYSRQQL